MGGDAHLGRPTLVRVRAQPVTDHAFEPADAGLSPGALVVSRRFLPGPVAKFENGREIGWTRPLFTTAIRGQPSLKAEPIRPFLGLLTNFATGPVKVGQ